MLISIIIPIYKAEKYLHACIDSILSQTYANWELLLVDDGSPDNSGIICDEYVAKDNRIRLLQRGHEGVGAARNAAIDIATGDKLCFVDADDTVEPDYLEQLVAHADMDLVVCGYMVDRYASSGDFLSTENHIHPLLTITSEEERDKQEEAFSSGIMHINCNKLYDMSIIRKYNLRYNDYPVNEDFIFVLNYLLHCQSITFVPEALYHWNRIEGVCTSVESIPQNILQVYEHSHSLLAQYLQNDSVADRIAYRSYELIIYKYLRLYRQGQITGVECFKPLAELHKSLMVRRSFSAYTPIAPIEKVLYIFNKHGLFRMTNAMQRLIQLF